MDCVNALYQYTAVPFHLIVVDDSTDLTPLYFSELNKERNNITYIHSDEPYKCGNQIFNIAVQNAKTPFIATVMNSITVEPQWFIQPLEIMRLYPKVGVIGFKCLFAANKLIEHAGIQMMSTDISQISKLISMATDASQMARDAVGYWQSISTHCPVDIGRDMPSHWFSLSGPCEATQWAFALLRKEAVAGNMDETIFNGFKGWDDIDNCYAVRKAGWDIFYCGSSVGIHTPRATRGDNSNKADQLNIQNAHVFFKRWGFWRNGNQPQTQQVALNRAQRRQKAKAKK